MLYSSGSNVVCGRAAFLLEAPNFDPDQYPNLETFVIKFGIRHIPKLFFRVRTRVKFGADSPSSGIRVTFNQSAIFFIHFNVFRSHAHSSDATSDRRG